MCEYPECEKLRSVREDSQIIGAFLDWLAETGREVCEYDERRYGGTYAPIGGTIEKLLAEYFEIDMNKVEEERRRMLAMQREINHSAELLEALG